MLGLDWVTLGLLLVVAALAAIAGIGGGGINMPLLMFTGGFEVKDAVRLSHSAVLGNALAQLASNASRRHPACGERPLIHHELALLLLPGMLGGHFMGVLLGHWFAPSVLVALCLPLLLVAGWKTLQKGIALQRQEMQGCVQPGTPRIVLVSGGNHQGASPTASPEITPMSFVRSFSLDVRAGRCELCPSHYRQSKGVRVPYNVIAALVFVTILTCIDQMLMSTDVVGMAACSSLYWAAFLCLYLLIAASLVCAINAVRALRVWHLARGDEVPIPGDPDLNGRKCLALGLVAILVGCLAGLLGLGGGEVIVPLLLEFGVAPRVAAATSGFLILLSVSTDMSHYALSGSMEQWGYMLGCFLVALFGASAGILTRDAFRQRGYIALYLLAGMLLVSACLLSYRGFVVDELDWHFGDFCP